MDDLKVFGCRSHPEFTAAICDQLCLEPGKMDVVTFKNENKEAQIGENVREKDVFVVSTATTPVHDHIAELLLVIDALKYASARRITAVIPYMPYARSDKKDKPRISVGLRLLAQQLELAGASRVLTMDLHSAQGACFFRIPVDQLEAKDVLSSHFAKADLTGTVIVAADVGEAKGIGGYANRLNLDIVIIDKRRDGDKDRAIPTNLVGDVSGKHCLLMDDEISTAGTVVEATTFLMDRGALSVRVGATHGVLVGAAVERLNGSVLKEVVVTDTVPVPPEKRFDRLKVLTVAPLFAKAISHIHDGRSVSALFNHSKK